MADRPRVAFVCAMPMEVRPLVRRLRLSKEPAGGVTLRSGTLSGHRVVATVTGMGTKLATSGVESLLDAIPVERVVVVGICGAVDDATPIGTLVRPADVVDSASGARYVPEAFGTGPPHGTLWTTDELITDLEVIRGLREEGVVALDMETAAIAAACESRGIPWSVFRVVSDRATDGSVNPEVFNLSNQDGSPNIVAVVRYLLRHPGGIPRLMRLARGARLATETAVEAAIAAFGSS